MSNPRVFSYIRFSTGEQALGDSERRQVDDAKQWAKRRGLALDESLPLRDRGLSGYHGTHRKKGKLGRFLRLVEAGGLEGSILLVENIDRLGREGPAKMLQNIIFKLWEHGVTLQTLSPEETYEPGCDGEAKFIALLIYLQRAYEESQRKSRLITTAREQERKAARDEKKILTRRCPAWLTVTPEGRFAEIKEATATIRMMFNSRFKGIGFGTIEAKLNESSAWQRPNGWRTSYIKKIITNPAVIGIYQPHSRTSGERVPIGDPIPDYYPEIVSPDLFYAVQAKRADDRNKGGRAGKATNLMRHMARCAYCGGPMACIDKGAKGGRSLVCDSARRRVKEKGRMRCRQRHWVRYDESETLLLENCQELRPHQVLPDPDEQANRCEALRQSIRAKETELSNVEKKIANFMDQIGETKDRTMRQRYEQQIKDLDSRKVVLASAKADADRELVAAESSLQSFKRWQQNLASLRKSLGQVEVRMKLQAHLRELIDKVEVFPIGDGNPFKPSAIDETGGTGLMFFGTDCVPVADGKRFCDYVSKRRRTKEGRFLRVFFKTMPELPLDLVPDGSLASGLRLTRPHLDVVDAWDVVEPAFAPLWADFLKNSRG